MPILDCHCHIDQYSEPNKVVRMAADREVFIIAMTNLPSHFQIGLPHVKRMSNLRLALGLHPLTANKHISEREQFLKLAKLTSYIGEVGLDFSKDGLHTKDIQVKSFIYVLSCIVDEPKVISIHSRGAELEVIDTLMEFKKSHTIFHWYSGPLGLIDKILNQGHYFSINPSMIESKKGQQIIAQIPPERILTETDGPYSKVGKNAAQPWDVDKVEHYLAGIWATNPSAVRIQVWCNFQRMLRELGLLKVNNN